MSSIKRVHKSKKYSYWKSLKEFVIRHRLSTVDALPSKARIFQRVIVDKLKIGDNCCTFSYEHIVNLHMCELKTKKHVPDDFKSKHTVITVPTYIRID